MDEILIGEKKYVSSKQAAKVTGYAKDYIGQLCREGRVPARLVGRSWYVLESAIQDHRFGKEIEPEPEEEVTKKQEAKPSLTETWESPRYEAAPVEAFPPINRLKDNPETQPEGSEQDLQDSWKTWFDHFDDTVTPPTVAEESTQAIEDIVPVAPEQEEQPEEVVEDSAVSVQMHVISRYYPPREVLPEAYAEIGDEKPSDRAERRDAPRRFDSRVINRSIQVIGVLIAVVMASLAILGSGRFDGSAVSLSQASALTGVSVYFK